MLASESSAAAFPLTRFRGLARVPEKRAARQARHACQGLPIPALGLCRY